jgi:lysophospholipase L1-like esterase
MESPSMPRALPVWKKLFVSLLCLILVPLFLEAGVRLYVVVRYDANWDIYNVWNGVYENHPHSWYRVRPDSEFKIFGGSRVVRTDSHGFRSPEPEATKGQGTVRIAFLGGSTTFNNEAPANEDTFPIQVGEILQKAYPSRRIEILNAAAAGYTTMESLTTLATRLLPLEPDIVVVYHGVNDATLRTGNEYRADYWRPPKPARTRFDSALYSHSLFFRFLNYKWITRSHSDRPAVEQLRANLERHPPDGFARNLRSIVAVAQTHGIEVVLCTFAYCPLEREDSDAWAVLFEAVDQHNEIVRNIAAEMDVLLLDVAAEMPRDPRLFSGQVHRNSEGLRYHARLLGDVLVERIEPASD